MLESIYEPSLVHEALLLLPPAYMPAVFSCLLESKRCRCIVITQGEKP